MLCEYNVNVLLLFFLTFQSAALQQQVKLLDDGDREGKRELQENIDKSNDRMSLWPLLRARVGG
jgi:hypothetical protein